MRKLFGILFAFLLLISCSVSRKNATPREIFKETTKIVYRDTTIFVKVDPDTVRDTIRIQIKERINTPVSRLETRFGISLAWIENSVLRHTLTQKNTSIPVTIKNAIQTTEKSEATIIREPYPVDKPVRMPLRWYQRFFMWSGVLSLTFGAGFLMYKFRRFLIF